MKRLEGVLHCARWNNKIHCKIIITFTSWWQLAKYDEGPYFEMVTFANAVTFTGFHEIGAGCVGLYEPKCWRSPILLWPTGRWNIWLKSCKVSRKWQCCQRRQSLNTAPVAILDSVPFCAILLRMFTNFPIPVLQRKAIGLFPSSGDPVHICAAINTGSNCSKLKPLIGSRFT